MRWRSVSALHRRDFTIQTEVSATRRSFQRLLRIRIRGTPSAASTTMRTGHLGLADAAVAEGDRHLDDPEAGANRPVGQLDLERVAQRGDRVEVDRLEHLAPDRLEAAGQVADLDPKDPAGIGAAAAADRPAHRPPVRDAAAVHVARADHEVGCPPPPRATAGCRPGRVRSRRPSGPRARHRARARARSRPRRRARAPPSRPGAAPPGRGSAAASRSAISPGAVGRVVVDHEDPAARRAARRARRR